MKTSLAWVCLSLVSLLLPFWAAGSSLESPSYKVLHEADDFELRLYEETVWAVAQVDDVSFLRATTLGFHRLFSYIEGANLNWTKIPMTAPVLTGIVPSAGPFCSSAFAVRLYLPCQFQEAPPTPLPELELTFEHWSKQTVAVRKFAGYAGDNNVAQEAEKLARSLKKSDFAKNATYPVSGQDSYAIAQYASPFQFWDRVNEVWVNIDIHSYDASAKEQITLKSSQ